jgi:tetratricopeptide (TPR) repeat protein
MWEGIMVKKYIITKIFTAFLFLSFLSCVSVNELEETEITKNKDSEAPEQIYEYIQPETENDLFELLLPEIPEPVSVTSENKNDSDVSSINSIIFNPEIDIPVNEEPVKPSEKEVVQDYLNNYPETPPYYSDSYIQPDTLKTEDTHKNSTEYTPVEYYSDTVTEDLSETASVDENEIYARLGDPITINLEKEGWIFLGAEGNQQLNGLKLVSSDQSGGYSNFTFNALELGTYALKFLHQDNTQGTQIIDTIHVSVLSDNDFEKEIMNTAAIEIPEEDLTYADALMNAGQYESAISEYLKYYRDNNYYLNDRLAEAYMKLGNYSLAKQYWVNNADSGTEFSEKAILGIINAAIAADNYETILRYVNRIHGISSISTAEVLINLTEYYKKRQYYQSAIDTYNLFMTRYPESRLLYRLYFIMGELYEENSEFRDFEKAVTFYEMIYQEFPESENARESRERVDYINRHFFYIR